MFTNKDIAGDNIVTKSSIMDDINDVLSLNSVIKDIPENNEKNACINKKNSINKDEDNGGCGIQIGSIENTESELVTLTDDDLDYLNHDDKTKIFDIQKELLRNKKYLDNQLYKIDVLTKTYDKFSKSVFETKLEMIQERTRILESMGKIVNDQIKRNAELDDAKDITEIFK